MDRRRDWAAGEAGMRQLAVPSGAHARGGAQQEATGQHLEGHIHHGVQLCQVHLAAVPRHRCILGAGHGPSVVSEAWPRCRHWGDSSEQPLGLGSNSHSSVQGELKLNHVAACLLLVVFMHQHE